MKSLHLRPLYLLLLTLMLVSVIPETSKAQKLKTLASNTFNGAVTGGILGGATMALQNSEQLDPVRFGVGLGTLGGLAIGTHDIAQAGEGQRYVIDGTFNRGHATTVIILLDSMYGGATGALVGSAINLMADEPIVNGIQYGVGAGIWGGFFFGLVDAFYLSSTKSQPIAQLNMNSSSRSQQWFTIQEGQTRLSFLQPQWYTFKKIDSNNIRREAGISLSMVEVSVQL